VVQPHDRLGGVVAESKGVDCGLKISIALVNEERLAAAVNPTAARKSSRNADLSLGVVGAPASVSMAMRERK
jgi:hypothetical protein